ncbi:branched-chain amino acid ABC transporter permease [Bradyrhizobium sp. 33ap4]|uniref:branched-chain amino acid ABC transporter permease n=1 Tax=Bradyrhizobium sp. 33ap4 TaxID=3061630 RepID=UPI00292CDD2D|nr:branched-chain amino acid ABC transporter permease [Bradyrhizobium sp. 33ap4]
MRKRFPVYGAAALLLAALVALAFVLEDFQLFQLTMVMAYAVALLGLNMLVGYAGQISLGHGAFFALGGYAAAIFMNYVGLPYWAAVPLAGLFGFIFGFIFGIPTLRLQGHYLALATFSLAVATPQILKWKRIEDWTGGVQGVLLNKPEPPAALAATPDQWLYLLALGVAAVLFTCAYRLLRGQVGRSIVAVRDHPIAAAAVGIDAARVKCLVFAVSALYTCVGGAVAAVAVQFVSPDTYNFFLSISLLVGVVVGGIETISGAVAGAIFIQFMPTLVGEYSKAAPWAIYGLILMAVVFVAPGGVARVLRRRAGGASGRGRRARPEEDTSLQGDGSIQSKSMQRVPNS